MAEIQVTSPPDAQLDFDDGDLKAIATVYLEEGNKEYRRKEASNALSFYTQGIQINCKDDVLNAKLYSNRATAHFYLGNFQETLHDATAAVTLKPTFIKAIEKGASACVKLKRYEEAMTWCDKGLAIDNNKKTLVDLRTKCLNEPDSLQETKQQNMKILPVSGIATGQNGTDSIPRTIGNACDSLKDVKTAFEYHQCHLKTAIEVGDRAGEGIAHHNLGVIAFEHLGDLKTAIYHLERHLEIAKEVGEKTGEGSAHHNLGNAYRILGDIKKALYHHERGHEIAKEAGNKAAEGITLNGIGLAYSSQGKFKPAIDHYERSLNIAIEVGNKALEGKVYCNLGIAYRSLGKFERAIDSYERSIKLARDVGDKAGEGIAYGNLGNVYLELEEFETAIDYHKRGLKIAKEIGNKVGEGNICNTIGAAYLKRGLEIVKEERDKVGEGNVCSSTGAAYQSRGYFNTAKDYFERHLKIAREVGDKAGEGMAYCGLGNAYKGLNDFKAAIDYQERGLEVSKEVGNNAVTATLFCMLGISYELQQSLAKAQECYHSSVRMFNIVRHDLKGKDEWKISYRNKCETAYTGLWRVLINQGKKEKSLLAADQGRAQALNDLMESSYGLPTTHFHLDDPEESTCNSFSFPRSVTVFIATDDKDIVFWVVQEGKEVKWDYRKHEYISLNLNEFFKSLIMTARQEIGARACVKCENRSLDKLEDEQVANESTITPVPLQMSALRTLYDIIINPIARLLHGDELIFVPQGPLCLAPFAALMDSNSRYLCDARRIRVIPSLTSLKMITDSPDSYHSKTEVLLVGDPWVQEVVIPGINLEQLKYARKEVQMIGRIFNTKPLIGREATKNEVLRRLPSVALIHIAAHGAAGTGEIALAPNITRASQIPANEDFLLTMKDVTSAQLRARLVVLSCCHSGRGEIKAEGVVGIARAFLGAGARAVLVSLWAIDDEATLEFMKSFYSHLVKGISASESLNNAMKHMRESDEFNEVKHWAPFVLIGDDVTLELGGSE